MQDVAILERPGFGLIGINDDVVRLAVIVFDEAPFRASRKTGTTTTTKVGRLDEINDLTRLHGESFFQRFIAAMGEVGLDVGGVARLADISKNDPTFFRMRSR